MSKIPSKSISVSWGPSIAVFIKCSRFESDKRLRTYRWDLITFISLNNHSTDAVLLKHTLPINNLLHSSPQPNLKSCMDTWTVYQYCHHWLHTLQWGQPIKTFIPCSTITQKLFCCSVLNQEEKTATLMCQQYQYHILQLNNMPCSSGNKNYTFVINVITQETSRVIVHTCNEHAHLKPTGHTIWTLTWPINIHVPTRSPQIGVMVTKHFQLHCTVVEIWGAVILTEGGRAATYFSSGPSASHTYIAQRSHMCVSICGDKALQGISVSVSVHVVIL